MPKKKERCSYGECVSPAKRQGLCVKHLSEGYTGGCTVNGCVDPATGEPRELFAKGRCKPHHQRWWRSKHSESAPAPSAPVRSYGVKRVVVFTRVTEDVLKALQRAAGTQKGVYTKAQEILTAWAEAHAR